MPRRLKPRGLIEGADMEVRFRRPGQTFARKGRTAPGAKSAARSPRRRIELGYFSFTNLIRLAVERHEDRNRRAGVFSTALAMAPIFPLRFASGDKADCAAKAPAFEVLDRTAHILILQPGCVLAVGSFRQSCASRQSIG
jgi:hypothetical protein